ncbi:MAG: hypothetical protein WBO06_08535 [Gammaproteobacteria bacterium]
MARLLNSLLWPILLTSLYSPVMAGNKAKAPAEVRDLQYGEVLFHFYQQDYFNSIVQLLKARQQERLPHHGEEAELLLGGLDLSYGLRNEAAGIFQRLLTRERTDDAVRNRAWYYLARIDWQRGEPERALQILQQIEGRVPESITAETAHLKSLALLQLGRHEDAMRLLQQARGDKRWTPYLQYNLAVAQLQGVQAAAGIRQLERIGALRGSSDETRLLRDKANLALGYSLLKDGAAKASRGALERVRLQGPLSNKALLGTGWADVETGAFARALVPWTELSSRSATDPAVQESLLAIPYAMAKMNLHGRAVESYERAIETLIRERQRLDESILAIRAGGLLEALQATASGNGWLAPLEVEAAAATPALRYQVELMAGHEFQEAVKNYHDLDVLQDNLVTWASNIEAYDEMLSARQVRHATQLPAADAALRSPALTTLEHRYADLAGKLAGIEASDDPVGLANALQAQQWQRLLSLGKRLERLPASELVTTLREKQARLQGVLYWQLSAEYKARLWESKRQLAELKRLLAGSQQARAQLQQAEQDAPSGFSGFDRRIQSGATAITRLQARTAKASLAQGDYIERLAVAELERQQQRLDTYLAQARFAMAQTYDSALNPATDTVTGIVQ